MTATYRFSPSRRQLMAGLAAAGASSLASGRIEPAFARAPMVGAQAPGFYRFKLGAFEVPVVSDGPLAVGEPQAGMFGAVTKEEFGRLLSENYLPTDNIALEQNALVVNTGDRLVLIDTGLGSNKGFGP